MQNYVFKFRYTLSILVNYKLAAPRVVFFFGQHLSRDY
jgi:hypothetical protein